MNVIKFSHDYPKLWGQTEAQLIDIRFISRLSFPLNNDLIEYDTKTCSGTYYPILKNDYLQLIFWGNKGIPFSTIRRFDIKKRDYYFSQIGEMFEIKIIKKGEALKIQYEKGMEENKERFKQ